MADNTRMKEFYADLRKNTDSIEEIKASAARHEERFNRLEASVAVQGAQLSHIAEQLEKLMERQLDLRPRHPHGEQNSTHSSFQNNAGISGSSASFSKTKMPAVSLKVVAASGSNNGSASGSQKSSVLVEPILKEMRDGAEEVKPVPAVTGGVRDVYGEDSATEDQPVTPWAVTVVSGYPLLRDPRHNKGLAFTEKERDAFYLRGLLPPTPASHELQVKKMLNSIRQYQLLI